MDTKNFATFLIIQNHVPLKNLHETGIKKGKKDKFVLVIFKLESFAEAKHFVTVCSKKSTQFYQKCHYDQFCLT
jgi:hypothetical protein